MHTPLQNLERGSHRARVPQSLGRPTQSAALGNIEDTTAQERSSSRMSKLPRVRFVLPGLALAAVMTLLVACGGDDKPPVTASGGPSPTPGVATDAKCTGSDKITSIKRDGVRSYKEAP